MPVPVIATMPEEPGFDFKIEALIRCQNCKLETRLFGIESLNETRELYSFDCDRRSQA